MKQLEQSTGSGKNLNNVIKIYEAKVKNQLGELVRTTVEDTLNAMLDAEADQLCNAERYQRSEARKDTRAGFYDRKLHTKAGEVNLKVPKLRKTTFETAIIERYKRRESSVEESLIEIYLAGVSVRRVEDNTQALWGTFIKHLKSRGLKGVRMFITDKCMGLVESLEECYPDSYWQRCTVHWYRNVFSKVPRQKVREVATMLKAIHA